MKFDATHLRHLEDEHFRVLTAVELGMRNHEQVPTELLIALSGVRHARKCAAALLKLKLVHHDSVPFDSYRLTTLGYDYLALRALRERGSVAAVGSQLGTGKESDVFVVVGGEREEEPGAVYALKVHRLGRTCFRTARSKRHYQVTGAAPLEREIEAQAETTAPPAESQLASWRHAYHAAGHRRKVTNWLYLSRLAAAREFAYLRALHRRGLAVPEPIDANRHCVVMRLVQRAEPLTQVHQLRQPERVLQQLRAFVLALTRCGLVHGDLNEFNVLVDGEREHVTVIDFPQMLPLHHPDAQQMLQRDLDAIVRFFAYRFGMEMNGDDWSTEAILQQARREARVDAHGEEEEEEEEEEEADVADVERRVAEALQRERWHGGNDHDAAALSPAEENTPEWSTADWARPSDSGTAGVCTVAHKVHTERAKQGRRLGQRRVGNRNKDRARRKAVAQASGRLWG
ncbi:hypothetical protein CDCA_CDCA16G4201 [Cyanidium caldarium]|uniref:non-specific serine/threonine protein kinase n=1 Tax=Cyanidium caldarium TaxID=2771 RepID=A0AAV9J1D2_CYACA|nr:hypothetical protein CDCA_CDCA16G4201 [Cyanidium caldarium]